MAAAQPPGSPARAEPKFAVRVRMPARHGFCPHVGMPKNDEADKRTIQDDRAEVGEIEPGSPLDEGEGEDVSLHDDFPADAPATAPAALLGGAPMPAPADLTRDKDRLI